MKCYVISRASIDDGINFSLLKLCKPNIGLVTESSMEHFDMGVRVIQVANRELQQISAGSLLLRLSKEKLLS